MTNASLQCNRQSLPFQYPDSFRDSISRLSVAAPNFTSCSRYVTFGPSWGTVPYRPAKMCMAVRTRNNAVLYLTSNRTWSTPTGFAS